MFHRCLSHIFYYIPKLGLGCNSGKDLGKDKRDGQLVKHIDTGLYLLLYISMYYEESICCP